MPGAPFVRGDRLTLRLIEAEDYEFVCDHWNDPAVRGGAPMPTPISTRGVAGFVEEVDDAVQFLPCRDGTPVGYVMLFDVEPEASHAELGFWTVPDERGNGYATEAAGLCLDHAFDDRGLHKVFGRVFAGNDASVRVLEKLGFEREASPRALLRRRAAPRHGRVRSARGGVVASSGGAPESDPGRRRLTAR